MKNVCAIIAVMAILLNGNFVMVNGSENMENDSVIISNTKDGYFKTIDDIGDVSTKEYLLIDGNINYLYPTFDNQEQAFENFKSLYYELLETIKIEYSLDELSIYNWEDYYKIISNTRCKEKEKILSFFDIYENKYSNEEIIKVANSSSQSRLDELAMLLPYTSKYALEYAENNNQISNYYSFNVDAAVNYAIAYASNPNAEQYGYFEENDCTNFASQILENGGYNQKKTISKYTGWWHTNSGSNHEYSRSWTLADKFAKYMGINKTAETNYDFSEMVQVGDFIALDLYQDGDWNHIGFVTRVDDYVGSYGFYDYCVAQHSDNYHAWASTSVNSWDTQTECVYGIIRK